MVAAVQRFAFGIEHGQEIGDSGVAAAAVADKIKFKAIDDAGKFIATEVRMAP